MKIMLTLMHHSVPKWAQARGGWLNDGMKDLTPQQKKALSKLISSTPE